MLVHPAIERLRSEGAPQPQVDAVLAAWRALPEVGEVAHALAAWGAGGVLAADGALGHRAGVGAMETLALDRKAGRDLRWEALRQALGLDARAGMALLAELAERNDDPIGPPAARLRAGLIAAQPHLAMLETQ